MRSAPFLIGLLLGITGIHAEPPSRPTPATGAAMDTAAYSVVLHVKTTGKDTRSGTSDSLALRTIGKAFDLSRGYLSKGKGVKVLVHPGRYREAAIRMDGKTLDAPGKDALFVVEGTEAGKVIISGSERKGWEPATWRRLSHDTVLYEHPWPYQWPYDCGTWKSTDDGCIGWRREMVLVNGAVMQHEVTRDSLLKYPNSFLVNDSAKTVWLHPAGGLDSSDLIEIPAQLHLFRIGDKNNVVVRRLVFEHDNSYIMSKLNDGDGWGIAVGFRSDGTKTQNLLIEACTFRGCNATALKLHNWKDVTIRRCIANNNGWKGIGFGATTNILVEDCETSFNSWRQEWSHGTGWDAAGLKVISNADQVTIRRHYADSNTTASAIWFDSRNTNIVIDSCVMERHHFDPLYFEMDAGPTLVTNCIVRNCVTGITSYHNSNTIVEGCRFENIGGRMVNLISDERRRSRGRLLNENYVIRRCFFEGTEEVFKSGDATWPRFFATLDTDSNAYTYRLKPGQKVFADSSGKAIDFLRWQALGKDMHSKWASVAAPPPARKR